LVLRALVTLGLGVALAGCSSATGAPPAASVAESPITNDQLAHTAAVFRAVAGLQQQPCGQPDGATDTPEAACNRLSLGALIQFRAADLYAQSHGITLADDQVTKSFTSFQQSVGQQQLAEQLASNGVTEADVRELIRLSLVQEEVAKAVTSDRLPEERLRQRYQESIGDYTNLHVDHILVKTKAEAEKVYQQATAPGFTLKDFQTLAKKVSIDPNASNDSGELQVAASQLASVLPDAPQLQPGEIAKPAHTQSGWDVVWMIGKDVTPYAQARDKILQASATQEFQGWLRDQASEISVNPSFGRFDPQQLLVVRITSTDPSATSPPPSAPVNGAPATP
jgi:hypothetical protein